MEAGHGPDADGGLRPDGDHPDRRTTSVGTVPKTGSMGKPSPLYDVDIVDCPTAPPLRVGETGEIVRAHGQGRALRPVHGLLPGRGKDQGRPGSDGVYHTGDTAWRDEDGYFWYVGRADDVIKSSGYRIGPFEIESVIMELPYVLECAVTGAPGPGAGPGGEGHHRADQGHRGHRRAEERRFRTTSRRTPPPTSTPALWSSGRTCPRPSPAKSAGWS